MESAAIEAFEDARVDRAVLAVCSHDRASLEEITRTLEQQGFGVAVSSTDVESFAQRAEAVGPAVVIATGDPSSAAGAARLKSIRRVAPDARLIVVSPVHNGRVVRRLLKLGGDGLVPVQAIQAALAATVRAVLAGQVTVPRSLKSQVSTLSLSHREKQVLGMVVMGFTNSEIAGRLFLAESTVKSHLSTAFDKLGVHSRSEAAALILDPQEGLGVGILSIPEA